MRCKKYFDIIWQYFQLLVFLLVLAMISCPIWKKGSVMYSSVFIVIPFSLASFANDFVASFQVSLLPTTACFQTNSKTLTNRYLITCI